MVAVSDGVMTLTLNRPDALNSLTTELLDGVTEQLKDAAHADSVRVVVMTGAGRGFCAGQDLKEFMAPSELNSHLHDHYLPVVRAMRELEKPIVAAVNGVAAGAGMSLALAADLRIASDVATFVQAFVRIGLVPDAGGTFFLPRLVGMGRAMEMAMTGSTIDAATALEIGLVNRVVKDREFGTAVAEYAAKLAQGPKSLGLIKRAMWQSVESDLERQFANEEQAQMEALQTADFGEGVTAFLEKRAPRFAGR